MPELSIVVPIYKVEKYLEECIKSILNQSYCDYELILVDDGSPDDCPIICDYYAKMDQRIRVIHQENQGLVMARRNGLLKSQGKYISFIDGDDWIEQDMYKHIIQLMKQHQADVVVFGYKEDGAREISTKQNVICSGVYDESNMQIVHQKALYTGLFYIPGIIPAVWNKLFRRDCLINGFFFPDALIRMGEDAALSYPMLSKAKKIVIDNEFSPYHYRIVDSSMSRSYDSMYFDRARLLILGLENNLTDNADMLRALQYYCLFIIKIGILKCWQELGPLSVIKKRNIITDGVKKLKEFIQIDSIDWQGFQQEERSKIEDLFSGHIYKYMYKHYIERIKQLINS